MNCSRQEAQVGGRSVTRNPEGGEARSPAATPGSYEQGTGQRDAFAPHLSRCSAGRITALTSPRSGDNLTDKRPLELVGEEKGTAVEQESLDDFFLAVPPEDAEKFQKLAKVLGEQLSGVKVYKVGDDAQKQGDIGGRTTERRRAGRETRTIPRYSAENLREMLVLFESLNPPTVLRRPCKYS